MDVTVSRNAVSFAGIFDETMKVEDLMASFVKLKAQGLKPPVIIDFSNVSHANSSGVVIWLRFLIEAKTMLKYVNAPIWLVKQFSLIDGYFANGSYVESVQVPLFSPSSRESKVVVLEIGKDIPILKDYSDFKMPDKVIAGKKYEIDFSPKQYFSFISENHDLFKSRIK